MNEAQFKDKVIFITGGSNGSGNAAVKKFLAAGAKVCFLGSKQQTVDKAVADLNKINPDYPILYGYPTLYNEAEIQALVDQVVEKWGGIDVLINNAGTDSNTPLTRYAEGEFEYVCNVDMIGQYTTCRCIVPVMKAGIKSGRQTGGVIIGTGSSTAIYGTSLGCAYAVAKTGAVGLTRALGLELAHWNIRTACVCPGVVDTNMVASCTELAREMTIKRMPQERMSTPEEIADLYMYLSSEESTVMTATEVNATAGFRPW